VPLLDAPVPVRTQIGADSKQFISRNISRFQGWMTSAIHTSGAKVPEIRFSLWQVCRRWLQASAITKEKLRFASFAPH